MFVYFSNPSPPPPLAAMSEAKNGEHQKGWIDCKADSASIITHSHLSDLSDSGVTLLLAHALGVLVAGEGDLEGENSGMDEEGSAHTDEHTEGLEEGLGEPSE